MRTISLRNVVASLVALALFVPSAGAVSGELRTLYVLATWGPTPFTQAELQGVAAETDAFFRASSAGRFAMPGAVAGPITLPRPVFDSCDATALRSEAPPSLFAGYDRIAFVTPVVERCQFFGEANPTEVVLNGRLFRTLAVHELGHTLGLGHASLAHAGRPPAGKRHPRSRRASPWSRAPGRAARARSIRARTSCCRTLAGGARYTYAPGESFVVPRIFRVTVERHAQESASVRFEWLDRVAPSRPRLHATAGRGRVRLTWEASRERGSGVESYSLVADGRRIRTVSREIPLITWQASLRLSPGPHRVGVFATDRAGNRGRAASVRLRVK